MLKGTHPLNPFTIQVWTGKLPKETRTPRAKSDLDRWEPTKIITPAIDLNKKIYISLSVLSLRLYAVLTAQNINSSIVIHVHTKDLVNADQHIKNVIPDIKFLFLHRETV